MPWMILLLFFALTACQQDSELARDSASAETEVMEADLSYLAAPETATPPPPPDRLPTQERRLIRTAEMRIQVAELDSATAAATRLVSRVGGFIADSEFTNSSYRLDRRLTIRVPADRFDELLTGIGGIGLRTDYQRVNTQDVTEEWVDLESRLATKRAVRDRYIEILRNRAQTAKDILDAEDKIRVVTEEIEAQEARLRSLRDRVALSTLQLELYQEKRVEELPADPYRVSFWHQIGDSFATGWSLVKNFLLFLIAIWPVWLAVPFLVYGWRRWRKP